MSNYRHVEVNLFTLGDSADIHTWSNLPYFFSKALEEQGVKINRINLMPISHLIFKVYHRFLLKYLIHIKQAINGKDWTYSPCRDKLIWILVNQKIKKKIKKHSDSDFNIFLTFSFSSYQYSQIPVIHYCDITYENYLEATGRKKNRYDNFFIQNEKNNLKHAYLVCTTSDSCSEFIHKHYAGNNVMKIIGGPNLDSKVKDDFNNIIKLKARSKEILFIGSNAHRRGVDILIKAFRIFNTKNKEAFKLIIIGLTMDQISLEDRKLCRNVKFLGYLSKSVPEQYDIYLNALRSALIFVMPMRNGPWPGATMEAALFYTPVIITDIYTDDKLIRNGYNGILLDSLTPENVATQMDYLTNNNSIWQKMALNAHKSQSNRTWDEAAQNLLGKIVSPDHLSD